MTRKRPPTDLGVYPVPNDDGTNKSRFHTIGSSAIDPAIELTPRELEIVGLLWPLLPNNDQGEEVQINFLLLGHCFDIKPGAVENVIRSLISKGVIRLGPHENDGYSKGREKITLSNGREVTIDSKIVRPGRTYVLGALATGKRDGELIMPEEECRCHRFRLYHCHRPICYL